MIRHLSQMHSRWQTRRRALAIFFCLCGFLDAQALAQSTPNINAYNIDNTIYVDGVVYAQTGAGIVAAYSALPSCTINNDLNTFTNPPNTYQSFTWTHCGTIILPRGTYPVSSEIDISSPWIHIQGSDNGDTILNFSGTSGCAIKWTSNPFNQEFTQGPEIDNVRIDGGQSNSSGTCGFNAYNLSSLHTRNFTIANFNGSGSVCFNVTMDTGWAEKYAIDVVTDNCSTHYQVLRSGSGGGSTTGYGTFDIKMAVFAGQVGLLVDGGTCSLCGLIGFDDSTIHLSENEVSNPADSTAVLLRNGAQMTNNLYSWHFEAPFGMGTGHEINIDSTSGLQGTGQIDQSANAFSTNSISGTMSVCGSSNGTSSVNAPSCYLSSALNTSGSIGFQDTTTSNVTTGDILGMALTSTQAVSQSSGWFYNVKSIGTYTGNSSNGSGNFFGLFSSGIQNGTGSMSTIDSVAAQIGATNSGTVTFGKAFHVLSPNIQGTGNLTNLCGLCIDQQKVSGVTTAYAIDQTATTDQNLFSGPTTFGSRLKITDEGSCTMTLGACASQSLSSTYSTAPICIATWNGSGTLTGILKIPSTTTTARPASTVNTDNAVVNWACFGN
jgi:hypothetical protein